MALVTLQRSPSPSNNPEEEGAEGGEDGLDGRAALRHKRSKFPLERLRKIFSTVRFISKLRPCLSESYFTIKGAALILPHSDVARKTSKRNHGGEIQKHLQSMLYLLRPEDKIKVAIRLESSREGEYRYIALVSTMGRQDTEESVILGLDCTTSDSSQNSSTSLTVPSSATTPTSPTPHVGAGAYGGIASATIGLVLPIWMGMKVRLSGDGGFSISLDDKSYLFKPISVQAMWSAIQSLDKVLLQAEHMKYLAEGLTHTWVEYYRSKMNTNDHGRLSTWNLMEDVEIFAPALLSFSEQNEKEKTKLKISTKLKEVMMTVDLDEATSKSLRAEVEQALHMTLDQYRNYFDEEVMRILGQMDAPSKILDFLYLGSEWNASNLEELQRLGIKYILNVTREIDNFFTGMFNYYNVRLYDQEDSELLKHWLKTHKFINKAKKHDSKVLVHCKMGVSRSASTVIAYLMKENRWTLDKAYSFVKERRSCVKPNSGFMEQLATYEGILNASNKREVFRSKSSENILDEVDSEQGAYIGDSLFQKMSNPDWQEKILEEEMEFNNDFNANSDFTSVEPDLETRSADSMEESLPDVCSPHHNISTKFDISTSGEVQIFRDKNDSGSLTPLGTSPGNTSGFIPSGVLGKGLKDQYLSVGDPGYISRIKPDSSWIKLDFLEKSSMDASHHEMTDCSEMQDLQAENLTAITPVSRSAEEAAQSSTILQEGNIFPTITKTCIGLIKELPDTDHGNTGGKSCLNSSLGIGVDVLSTSRIKPDSSWIKLEAVGESCTDLPLNECSDAAGLEVQPKTFQQTAILHFSSPEAEVQSTACLGSPVEFSLGGEIVQRPEENVMGSSSPPPKIMIEHLDDNISSQESASQRETEYCQEIGIQQYYSKEQIPWSAGTVRSLRTGLLQGGHPGGFSPVKTELKNNEVLISDSSLLDSVRLEVSERPLCQSSEISPDQETYEEYMEVDAKPCALYEREDIPLTPGTVRRTRQEIEKKQKLIEDKYDSGLKTVQRFSLLKEEDLEKDNSRQPCSSDHRKTCTPVISTQVENLTENSMEAGILLENTIVTLGFSPEESSTDDVDMKVDEKVETEMESMRQQEKHMVHTCRDESVPFQMGIVQKHKHEIESKNFIISRDQRSSTSNTAYTCDISEAVSSVSSLLNHPITSVCTNSLDLVTHSGSVTSHNILTHHFAGPAAKEENVFVNIKNLQAPGNSFVVPKMTLTHFSPESSVTLQNPDMDVKECLDKKMVLDSDKEDSPNSGIFSRHCASSGSGNVSPIFGSQLDTNNIFASPIAALKSKSGSENSFSKPEHKQSHDCKTVSLTAIEDASEFISHRTLPLPSVKRQCKNTIDPETLAMFREIGAAFINSPPKPKNDGSGENMGRVQNLVKNIEKEPKIAIRERKIVLIDKSVGTGTSQATKQESLTFSQTSSSESNSFKARSLPRDDSGSLFSGCEMQCQSKHSRSLSFGTSQETVIASGNFKNNISESPDDPASIPDASSHPVGRFSGQQPPSVVRHLRGKFESRSLQENELCKSEAAAPSYLTAVPTSIQIEVMFEDVPTHQPLSSLDILRHSSTLKTVTELTPSLVPANQIVSDRVMSRDTSQPASHTPPRAMHSGQTSGVNCLSAIPNVCPSKPAGETSGSRMEEEKEEEELREFSPFKKEKKLHGRTHPLSMLSKRPGSGAFYSSQHHPHSANSYFSTM